MMRLPEGTTLEGAAETLEQRFCILVREHARTGNSNDMLAAASTLSLMAFGHDGILEGYFRDSAIKTAALIDPLLDDNAIMDVFAAGLPVRYADMPVRELFQPGR